MKRLEELKMLDILEEQARKLGKTIVFTEGGDDRVREAAKEIEKKRIAKVILLNKGSIIDKLNEGVKLLENREADGMISGATHETRLTIKAALKFKKGLVSSSFLMLINERSYLFADCAVIPEPNAEELAEIAIQTARTAGLFGIKPRIALLSYSTKGSADGESVRKVRKAIEIINDRMFEGEMQADVALNREIAKRKFPSSLIKGEANVLIFPNLDAGNIGYKLVQHFTKCKAIGHILQNLKKPVNDLSRGCSKEEIIDLAIITVLQGEG